MTSTTSPRNPFARRRRTTTGLVAVSATMALLLSACGDDPSTAARNSPVATVVDSSPATPPVIAVVPGGGAGLSATPGAAPAAGDAAQPEAMTRLAWMEYVLGVELPALDGDSPAWRLTGGDVDPARVAALAAALGLTGDVTEQPADWGGGWIVGPNDGSGPSLTVSVDGMVSWWYSSASNGGWRCAMPAEGGVVEGAVEPAVDPVASPDEPVASTDTIVVSDGDGSAGSDIVVDAVPVCEEPEPPVGVPTADEAEQLALALLASLGGDPAGYELETYADEWSASVTAFLVLDGMRTNLSFNVGYGEEGAITWAGGLLAAPQRGADYPRIGVDAAIVRLNDQANAWMTGYGPAVRDAGVATEPAVMPAVEPAVGEDYEAATEPTDGVLAPDEAVTSDDIATSETPTDSVLVDPAVGDCTDPAVSCVSVGSVDLAPMVIDLNQVTSSLEQVWAADGTVWLLPGYAFTGADGMMANVLAVEDQYLEQAEPEVVPLPEPLPVETAVPGPDAAPSEPAVVDAAFDGSTLVGLTVDEASKLAEAAGWTVRVAREDGTDLALTMDYSETRLNVAVEAGVVTEVVSIG